METLVLIAAVAVLGFAGFKFYQKRRKTEVHPLDAAVNKFDQPVEVKVPESNPHIEFPTTVKPEQKIEQKATEWNGFPKTESETKTEAVAAKPKRGGRTKKATANQQPKTTAAPRKKKSKTA